MAGGLPIFFTAMRYKYIPDSPIGKLVYPRTFAAIQAAYDAVPNGTTATLLLSGDYLRNDATTLNITNPNKTVWFKSWDGATLRDTNNTQSQAPLILINNQTGGGWDGIKVSTVSNYQAFNYGVVFVNETAPVVNYTFRRFSVSCPNLLGNGITVQAWSDDNNNKAGGGCIHKNIVFDDCDLADIGRMGLELTCHNEKEAGIPTRIFGVTVRNCRVSNTGLQFKAGMGVSFSGSLEDVLHTGNRYTDCKQYFVEFIGVRSGTTGNNVMVGGKLWGDGAQGSGSNKTNGYNFTDGENSGLGAKNITISNDEINVNGRPMLCYGCSHLTFTGGVWRGGQYLDINRGTKSDGSGSQSVDITMNAVDVIISGDNSYNVLVVNNSTRCQFLNLNLTSVGANGYSVINIYNNCSKILLSGGSWRRPVGSQDNMANLYATDSQPIGPHLESTF